ncbi:MAG: YvcK family protein [Anaerolineaceae bacterium]|nr:YvcK family protein [Anaerolineaceae bacterium]
MPKRNNLLYRMLHPDLRWFMPGIGIKRWIGVILIGTTFIGFGFAVVILDIYRKAPEVWWGAVLAYLSLRFLDRVVRALIFGGIGIGLVLFGVWGLNKALLRPFVQPGRPILDAVSAYRRKERGPRIVVLGGGTGLSAMLRGLKTFTHNLTAIVTVADDGGSSGELRRNMGILPPGDIRNCLAALSDDEAMLTQLFQYRFSTGTGLDGHTLGNLLITALTDLTGSFEKAVTESGRVLAVKGRVIPATLHDVKLIADVRIPFKSRIRQIRGESNIPEAAGEVRHVRLEPDNPQAFPPAIQAILSADLIIVGPGSLYTSLLPNLLVPDIADAIRSSRGLKFFVCNVATQPGETDGYSCDDHVLTIYKHLNSEIFDVIISNNNFEGQLPEGVDWVRTQGADESSFLLYLSNLIDEEKPWRHHSSRLAQVIIDLYNERTGPLINKDEV